MLMLTLAIASHIPAQGRLYPKACPSVPRAIVCNGDLLDRWQNGQYTGMATGHTIVHELGHQFDYRSEAATGQNLSTGLGLHDANDLRDCDGDLNHRRDNSAGERGTRGERGWGSGPAHNNDNGPLITDFSRTPRFSQERIPRKSWRGLPICSSTGYTESTQMSCSRHSISVLRRISST